MKICGIDEAGRGPLAGPLVIVALVLKENIEQLDDSKKLTAKKRENLFFTIKEKAIFETFIYSNGTIDQKGLSFCFKDALCKIKERFKEYEIIFDGNTNFKCDEVKSLVKADSKVKEVSAASIVAKVTRDNIMINLDKQYPQYNFKQHKGYGTKEHREKIKTFGLSPIHRESFCKGMV